MSAVSDEVLMTQLAGGQDSALRELLKRYWPLAYRYARTLCKGDPGAADDVAQEGFLQIYLRSSTFNSSLPFRPWFFRILQNSARKRQRGERRRGARERIAARDELSEEASRVEKNEEWSLVKAQLKKLPEDIQETLELRFLEGLPVRTIAEISSCPEGTVSSRIRRGLDMLRERIGPRLSLSAVALSALLESQAHAEVPPCPDVENLLRSARERSASHSGTTTSSMFVALMLGIVLLLSFQLLSPDQRPTLPTKQKTDLAKKGLLGADSLALEGSKTSAYQGSLRASQAGEDDPWANYRAGKSGVLSKAPGSKAFALRGRLLLAGRPMTGVIVCLRRNGSNLIDPPVDRFTEELDSEGRFQFDAVPGKAEFWSLDLRHEAYGQNLYFRLDRLSQFSLSAKIEAVDLRNMIIEPELIPVRVSGTVKEVSTKRPISGAIVGLWRQSVTTGRDGRYSLLAARSINLFHDYVVARANDRNTVAHVIFAKSGERLKKNNWENIDFELGRGKTLKGQIVDEWGRPRPKFIVETRAMISNQSKAIAEDANITGVGWTWKAETDSNGEFQLLGLEANQRHILTIYDKNLTSLMERHYDVEPRDRTIKIIVKSNRQAWNGHIVDPEGKGIEDARVIWVPLKKWLAKRFLTSIENGEMIVKNAGASILRESGQGGVRALRANECTTGRTGDFYLDVPERGWLLVSAPGYASRIIEINGPRPKQLALNVEERLTGVARNEEGKAVSRVLVNAYEKGTIARFQRGRQILRGQRGLTYGPRTPQMIISGNKRAPIALASAITDRFGRYSLEGLDSGAYDIVVNPLWSFLNKKSEWTDIYRKEVPTGSELDFELKSMNLGTVQFRTLDAQTGSVLIGCRFSLFNEKGALTHFSDPWKDFDPSILQFPASDKLYLQLTKPGYGKTQLSFSGLAGSTQNLGAVYLQPVIGALNLEVKAPVDYWKKIEFFIHEREAGIWSWKEDSLAQEIERVEFPDLNPGKIEINPYLRGGDWPNETFLKLETIHSEIERDRLTIEKLDLRDSKFQFRKPR